MSAADPQSPPPTAPTAHRNSGCSYRETISPASEGLTVLAYLVQRYSHSSPEEWAADIAAGNVVINGKPARSDCLLIRGSELVRRRPPWTEPEAPRCFEPVYEDEHLLVVAKPAGLPTLPGANFFESTLLRLVQAYDPDAAPLHRLGRWTSGLVLCARTAAARSDLTRQWAGRRVFKRYRALAVGAPERDRMEITTPIGAIPHPLLGAIHAATPSGKPALSRVTVLERRAGLFLCDVQITTGRPHQIRIHLAAAGHPLLGDPLYGHGGAPRPDTTAVPGDPGYHLHAAELGFRHPATGLPLTLTCEPPPLLRTETDRHNRSCFGSASD